MSSTEELTEKFNKLGLEEVKIKEILKNKKVLASFDSILSESSSKITFPLDKTKRLLLHQLAILSKGETIVNRQLITESILNDDLKSNQQLDEAFKYVKANGDNATKAKLDEVSGVGIIVTEDQVKSQIQNYIQNNKNEIEEKRYQYLPKILANVRTIPELKWANPGSFKPIIDEELSKLLGPKDERDVIKKEKKSKKPAASTTKPNKSDDKKSQENQRSMFTEGFLGDLHKVGENPQKYPELMVEHLKQVKNQVHTRFPPEPNGFLHIGHSKAILVNFGFAKHNNGVCYLRYDDTNPEAEEDVYFKSILKMVNWLGFEPFKITYSSDYFDELYQLAENLIKNDLAYVCHDTAEEIKRSRGIKEDGTPGGERIPSKDRNRPIEESLKEFRKMRDGFYKPGEATLRMKQDLSSPNPQMWDLIAYRVLNASHPRTGDKWKIYPTYDFTHCLVDSFENITHSLCTTEFYLSRESYEWLCDALHVYRPAQREYGRLNITGTVLSKRKIAKLVNENYVRGWDDPRLFTLEAIKRRGVPPGAILTFINTLGVTTSTTNIQVGRFESSIRKFLEDTVPRLMLILNPIEIEIDNVDDDFELEVEIPYKPGNDKFGSRKLTFTKNFYIDSNDFSEDDLDKEFFRLKPNQPVGLLKIPYNVSFKSLERDSNGKITKIHVNYDNEIVKKPKTYIQWIPKSSKHNSPIKIKETRVYNQLFNSENPSAHPEGFLKDINPDSEEIFHNSIVEPAFKQVLKESPWSIDEENSIPKEFNVIEDPKTSGPEIVRFQALRVGYFALDKDSSDDSIILNRIVSLKESTK
ncbi:glutaminyl-tRNA synthetase [Wickerhamomyces ciferrii]|uniref:glutamine--tRNA ligase n=1 Tax=Wickerhamomyces ciferrii (strain ATCC 14091 / BCRC 22168 / CBS 111 / JCM 3599 / NBRC 0793 / NRRL Y-1031 F-60-10) TaxID=1206466 RepID=K0KLA9_WICCF|nr:glutaminyl-tRNA synthetase [Wickerhamomyces ciferrii]CCH41893.1 glutaminyl-tRNA synthetase [Wickerhamomyces ciferrii]